MQDEARVVRTQRTAFYQQAADTGAREAGEFMTGQLRAFSETVDRLLAASSPEELRPRFHQSIRNAFPLAEAGVVFETGTGRILPQTEPGEPLVTAYVAGRSWFFRDEPQPVYLEIPSPDPSTLTRRGKPAVVRTEKPQDATIADVLEELAHDSPRPSVPAAPASRPPEPLAPTPPPPVEAAPPPPPFRAATPLDSAREKAGEEASGELQKTERRIVLPGEVTPPARGGPSQLKPVMTTLAAMIARDEAGIASVPREEGLFTFVWYRPPDLPGITFAAGLEPDTLRAALTTYETMGAPDDDTSLVILDHLAQPVARWTAGEPFTPVSWTAPAVARELGAALPHWEAAVFLRDPAVMMRAASGARWRLGIIVTAASLVAVAGALFILRDARRAAQEARLKTDFVSNVSHELKTPLTSIRMFSDLLGNNPGAPPDKTKRYAEVIATEAARLTRLINNVLNFSRMEGGREELQDAPLDLRALTLETVDHMRPQLERDGFSIHLELPDREVPLHGDRDALSQVLLNLLSNAGKYGITAGGPRELTVTLTPGEKVRLTVADRGDGVPRGQERRIFEKFQRAHNTLASGTAGSGLGLTIARRLVEAHRGTLDYRPRDGGGAEFTVTLTSQN
jgi:signal transduction histidine kinase